MHGKENTFTFQKNHFLHWIWYAIEFGIVLAISMLISREITDSIEELAPECTKLYVYGNCWCIFLVWYIGIRGFILKTKILEIDIKLF